jgi:hypothetical protein
LGGGIAEMLGRSDIPPPESPRHRVRR